MARGAILATFVLACGASTKPPASAEVSRAPASDAWTASSWVDRHATMTFTVLPNMARLWQSFDHDPWPDVRCTTCHGDNAEVIAYRMPSDAVPALDPSHMPRADSPDADEAKVTRFMTDKVVPEMNELMGTTRVTCFSCHARKGGKS